MAAPKTTLARAAETNGGEVVATKPKSALEQRQDSIASMIRRMIPEIGAAVPKHVTPERMARICTTVMRQNPDLAKCDEMSLIGAIMTCAQLGLEPGPTGQAYLIPYGRECTFVLGYKGMMALARRSGEVETIYAEAVYKEDHFDYGKGLNPFLEHKPYTGEKQRGTDQNPFVYVYAVVKYKGGGYNFEVLSKEEVDFYRKQSKSPNSPMWQKFYVAASKKTAIRRLATYMPQDVEFATALAVDGKTRDDLTEAGLDRLAANGDEVWEGEVVNSPVSAPPAGMNPDTGEVPAEGGDTSWPEVRKAPE